MYLKKSGFICLNVYINLPYLYRYRYFKKRMIEKKQITITYCRVLCK